MPERQQRLPAEAARHYRQQKALAEGSARRAGEAWDQVDPGDISRSWEAGPKRAVREELERGQARAATLGDRYVGAVAPGPPKEEALGRVRVRAFVGSAADGRQLDSLLDVPVVRAKQQIRRGAIPADALAVGRRSLQGIVGNEVLDAGRAAAQVGMVSRPWVVGWIRVLSVPSCGRCAILAGKFFLFNKGFDRHPRCDCQHLPASVDAITDRARAYRELLRSGGAGAVPRGLSGSLAHLDPLDLTVNVRNYFDVLNRDEQDRYFGKAGAEAIRGGADIGSVVNARRKGAVYTVGGREFTREATGRGKSRGRYRRPTPTQILREAGDDRDEMVRLLRLHRYLF